MKSKYLLIILIILCIGTVIGTRKLQNISLLLGDTNNLAGDINGDGKVSSIDYILVRKHIMGQSLLTGNDKKKADVNNDGKVSSIDYVKIKKMILNGTIIPNNNVSKITIERSKYILTTCVVNTDGRCHNKEQIKDSTGNNLDTTKYNFKSSNANVVKVDASGIITAMGAGDARIEVFNNNTIVATADVKVYAGGRALYNDSNANAYTVYESNILEFGADPYGNSDSTNAVVQAMTTVHGLDPTNCEVATASGGVVFVPSGLYKISNQIQVSCNAGLVGELKEGSSDGSVFLITSPQAQIFMNKNSGIENLAFYIPNYDNSYRNHATILSGYSGIDTLSARNIFFVNANIGMNLQPGMTTSIIILRNIYGAPTKGVINDKNLDTIRLENIDFNANYYNSGLKSINKAYKLYNSNSSDSYYKNNSISLNTGVELKRVDWYYLAGLNISGYNKAISLTSSANGYAEGSCYDCHGTSFNVNKSKHFIMTKSSFNNFNVDANSSSIASILYTNINNNLNVNDSSSPMIFGNLSVKNYNVLGSNKGKVNVSNDSSSTISNLVEPSDNSYNYVKKEKTIKTKPNLRIITGKGDITSELKKNINELKANGGIIYLPGGNYTLNIASGPIDVFSNIEIRGSTPWLHDRFGAGRAHIKINSDSTAFRLYSNSGINGISIEYNENTSNKKAAIVGNGSNIYVVNTNISAAGIGIDFSTNRCDNHYVDKLYGVFFQKGISVGSGSTNGIIRDSHFTTNQLGGYQTTAGNYSWKNEIAFDIGNSNGEKIFNNAVWGANIGIKIFNATNFYALQNGIDYAYSNAVSISGKVTGQLVNQMLVSSPENPQSLYIDSNTSTGSNVEYINNMFWGNEENSTLIKLQGVGNHKFYGGIIGELTKPRMNNSSVITSSVSRLDINGMLFYVNRSPFVNLQNGTSNVYFNKNICVNKYCQCSDISKTGSMNVSCS